MPTNSRESHRSEQLRKKRASNPRKTMQSGFFGKKKKSKASDSPPVMVRSMSHVTPFAESKRKNRFKRRYDVSLSTPGAEMQLPSIPRLHVGWRIISAILVGVLGYLLYLYSYSPVFRVSASDVDGLERITKHDVNIVANVSEQPVFAIDPDKVEQNIREAFFDLSDVSVEVSVPASVNVFVEERKPILVWHQEGQTIWVDSSGVAFPPRGDSQPSVVVNAVDALSIGSTTFDMEMLTADESTRFLPPQLISAILAISIHAPENTPLVYTADHGLGWQDPRGWDVYFGIDLKDIEMKLLVYDAIVSYVEKAGIQPTVISVEYVHAPYYRVEQ